MSTATESETLTEGNEFQVLKELFPGIIAGIPGPTFTSHEFIRKMGKTHQRAYVQALCHYSEHNKPFQTLHGLISGALNEFPDLVKRGPDVPSTDIFGNDGECASWEKK